jgi:hypothetical protein
MSKSFFHHHPRDSRLSSMPTSSNLWKLDCKLLVGPLFWILLFSSCCGCCSCIISTCCSFSSCFFVVADDFLCCPVSSLAKPFPASCPFNVRPMFPTSVCEQSCDSAGGTFDPQKWVGSCTNTCTTRWLVLLTTTWARSSDKGFHQVLFRQFQSIV